MATRKLKVNKGAITPYIRKIARLEAEVERTKGPVSNEFLLAFVRHLIRETTSSDMIWLALDAAKRETGATKEELEALLTAVSEERTAHPIYPPGFMP